MPAVQADQTCCLLCFCLLAVYAGARLAVVILVRLVSTRAAAAWHCEALLYASQIHVAVVAMLLRDHPLVYTAHDLAGTAAGNVERTVTSNSGDTLRFSTWQTDL